MPKIEVTFYFSFNNEQIKEKVNSEEKVASVLKKIIQKNSYNNIEISVLICNSFQIDISKSFKENKLKNGDIIMVMSDLNDDNEPSTIYEENQPLRFEVTKCITTNSHVNLPNSNLSAFIDRTFTVFKSINSEYFLIYSSSLDYKNYSLVKYNILEDKTIFVYKNAHKERIFTCSHFLDKYNKRDLLLTAAFDKKIKIWNVTTNFQLIYKKKPDYNFRENTYLLSENILSYNHKIYLTTSAYEINSDGYYIFYYSLRYDDIGKLNNSKNNTNHINTYYENNIPYIVAANCGNIKVYNFSEKNLIKTFSDDDDKINYLSVVITIYSEKKALIASSSDGILRIWDYDEPEIFLNKIKTYSNQWLVGIDVINDRFLIAGCGDGTLKEFDLKKNFVSCSLERKNYKDSILAVQNININGKDYLFSHSFLGRIEVWNY